MKNMLLGPFDPRPAPPPRVSLGRGAAGTGLAACFWLWTGVSGLHASLPDSAPAPSAYRQALASCQQHDYEHALNLAERPTKSVSSVERDDFLNLRGAIYPRQERNDAGMPTFRYDAPPSPAGILPFADLPPTGSGVLPDNVNHAAPGTVATSSANVLAKPRRSHSSPTPAPTATPSESPDTQSGTASPAATPAPSASPATPTPDGTPAASSSSDFLQKYEAAYVAFLKKDYPTTLSLLDEADKVQPKQPQSVTLRKQVFKQAYETAYLAFRKADYPAALAQLDLADSAQKNNSDALNLRGLVFSKQRDYDQAEIMFKKAVEADPTLWAAKFNYAELPFNRGDYTTARSRYEDLLGETDNVKLPNEYELAQYKVFLTLLLEGKTDQARSFMDHFNFSGHTPAKYFCNAAMNFRAGSVDKANNWINSARREYPANLVKIFIDSFYRLGWVADPNALPTGTAVAAASPGVEAVAPGVTPASGVVPPGSSVVAAAPPGNAAPGSPPGLLASSSPSNNGLPAAAASTSPAVVPSAVAAPSAAASPAASPLTAANASATAATPVTPAASPLVTPAPTASADETAAADLPSPAGGAVEEKGSTVDDALRLVIGAGVLIYGLYVFSRLLTSATRRKTRRSRIGGSPAAPVDTPENEPAKSEAPR